MSFVLQHYPFTKPQLLEIHTSLLPPSNDSLKMNAQKTDPPRSCQSHTNRENICFGTCWFTNTKGLRSTCHSPPLPFILFTAINLDIFGQVLCVSKHICPQAVPTFAVSLVFQALLPTRRWFNTMLDDSHMVVRCLLSGLIHREEEGHLFCQVRSR